MPSPLLFIVLPPHPFPLFSHCCPHKHNCPSCPGRSAITKLRPSLLNLASIFAGGSSVSPDCIRPVRAATELRLKRIQPTRAHSNRISDRKAQNHQQPAAGHPSAATTVATAAAARTSSGCGRVSDRRRRRRLMCAPDDEVATASLEWRASD